MCPDGTPADRLLGFSRLRGSFGIGVASPGRCTVTQILAGLRWVLVRVWELAEELHILSSELLELIAPYDPYVTSHLANVPHQAIDPIRANPPPPTWGEGEYLAAHPHAARWYQPLPPPTLGAPQPLAGRARRRSRGWRRPGPARVSFEPPYEVDEDGYDNDPVAELVYEPLWSTRDVARYFGVKAATVRQWVKRGYLAPSGTHGPSHVFDKDDVLDAVETIRARERRTALAAPPPVDPAADETGADGLQVASDAFGYPMPYRAQRAPLRRRPHQGPPTDSVATRQLDGLGTHSLARLASAAPNSLVTTSEAADLLGLSPATLRSWVARGHLRPSPSSKPRALLFRIADVYSAARRR